MTSKAIIVHSLEQARLAARTAAALEVPVLFTSAPAGAAYLGPAWLDEVTRQIQSEFPGADVSALLDCGDAPGHVLAALRSGVKAVRFTGRRSVAAKLKDMAKQQGAEIVTGRIQSLDLALEPNPETACRAWLAAQQLKSKAKPS